MLLNEFLDTSAKTLFARRPILNIEAIQNWAKEQGFQTTLGDDLHVTVGFSEQPFHWQHLQPEKNRLTVRGGHRSIKRLGDKGAIALCFQSTILRNRWQEFKDEGASCDFPNYMAHVTISYNDEDLDISTITPYSGELTFGPEKFNEIQEDWVDNLKEDNL